MNIEEFKTELEKLNINYTSKQLEQLETYYQILVEENKKYNLTAIIDKEEAYLKHFYDSLTLLTVITDENIKLCDIGSGAGFPGIVLKIFVPEINITLVDSSNKKTEFLKLVIKKLNLENIEAINSRSEELKMKEEFDIVTARAVASLPILLEISSQLIKINGYFIALKGKNIEEEIKESASTVKKLGFKLKENKNFNLPNEGGERNIIKFEKVRETAEIYPRNYSQIKKNPL